MTKDKGRAGLGQIFKAYLQGKIKCQLWFYLWKQNFYTNLFCSLEANTILKCQQFTNLANTEQSINFKSIVVPLKSEGWMVQRQEKKNV